MAQLPPVEQYVTAFQPRLGASLQKNLQELWTSKSRHNEQEAQEVPVTSWLDRQVVLGTLPGGRYKGLKAAPRPFICPTTASSFSPAIMAFIPNLTTGSTSEFGKKWMIIVVVLLSLIIVGATVTITVVKIRERREKAERAARAASLRRTQRAPKNYSEVSMATVALGPPI